MFRAVKTLFLKEWRQIFPIWLALLFCCVLMHLAIILIGRSQQHFSDTDTIVGVILPIYGIVGFLYVAVAGSTIFCREHEEKTYHFLRRLPIPRGAVCVSKIAAVLISSATLLIILAIALHELIDLMNTENGSGFWRRLADTNLIFTESGYSFVLFVAFTFGLFWSTQCKNQLNSVLLTISTVVGYCIVGFNFLSLFLAFGAVGITNYSDDTQLQVMTAVGLSIASIPVWGLLIITLLIAWRWIEQKDSDQLRRDEHSCEWDGAPIKLQRPRSPFMALVWQTVRQSRFLLALGLVNGLIALIVAVSLLAGDDLASFLNHRLFFSDHLEDALQAFVYIWLACTYPFILFYCGTVFWRDQTQNRYRFLTIHGVSGRQVWWSRMAVFGTVCFWWCLVFAALVVGSLIFTHWTRTTPAQIYINPKLLAMMVDFGIFYLLLFAVGQLCSLFFRRWLISCFVMSFIFGTTAVWSIFIMNDLGISTWITLLPICLTSLLATRLRIGDWLRDRNAFRHYLKALSPIVVAVLLICITIPAIRIGAIPVASREIWLPKIKHRDAVKCLQIVDANDQWLTDKTKKLRLAQGDIGKMEEVWLEIQAGDRQQRHYTHLSSLATVDMFVYTLIDDKLTTLENESFLRPDQPAAQEALNDYRNVAKAFIESMPEKRSNRSAFTMGYITTVMVDLANNRFPVYMENKLLRAPDKAWHYNAPQCEAVPFAYRLMFPWEKRRAVKALQYYSEVISRNFEAQEITPIPITSFYDRCYLIPAQHLPDNLHKWEDREKENREKLLQRLEPPIERRVHPMILR